MLSNIWGTAPRILYGCPVLAVKIFLPYNIQDESVFSEVQNSMCFLVTFYFTWAVKRRSAISLKAREQSVRRKNTHFLKQSRAFKKKKEIENIALREAFKILLREDLTIVS